MLGPATSPSAPSSKPANSKPGATVQPTSVQSPRLSAACQTCGRDDRLRAFAGGEVGAERHAFDRTVARSAISSRSGAPA